MLLGVDGYAIASGRDQDDPFEKGNRVIYRLNDSIDRTVLNPIAQGYRKIVPTPVNKGISNFFGNLNDITTTINDLLQFKLRQGGTDAARVLVNSSVGILGLVDIASSIGLEKHNEDFGQTLGYWGIGPGSYIMLPLYGPSSLRDAIGYLVDTKAFDPLYKMSHTPSADKLMLLKALDKRADLLPISRILGQASLDDRYRFLKEAYLQQREHVINDGELLFLDDELDFPE